MRVLFLSNFYPPASRGGYEQWCQEVAEELRNRGHDVLVLTSDYRRADLKAPDPDWVRRELHLEMEMASLRNAFQFFTSRKAGEEENLTLLKQLTKSFSPDVVLIWGMWNLHRSLPALAETLMPGRIAYYMGDYWPTLPNQFENYWQAPARNFLTGIPKLLLKPAAQRILSREKQPDLGFEHVLFPTAFMRDELARKGIFPKNATVIYGAINTRLYQKRDDFPKRQHENLSLLYIGRLTHEKGVHTAIEALGLFVRERGITGLKLTIVGNGEPDYESHLRQIAKRENIESFVTFLPAQPKDALPALYHQADIFLFTSIWAEPFGRVIVEALASEVTVVGTAVGGAAEILIDNGNALVFTPNDPVTLAGQLARLIGSPSLRQRLAKAGQETAVQKFDLHRMTTEIETYLQTLAN